MRLFGDLEAIVRQVEASLAIRLNDEHFADGHEEIVHIFLHEACHAAVACCVPWIHDLGEREHTTLDEILARILEGEIGAHLGLQGHSPQEHVRELALYPVNISVAQYEHLQAQWHCRYGPAKDLAGMATCCLAYLRQANGDLTD